MAIIQSVCNASNLLSKGLNACVPVVLLLIRIYIAQIFLNSGWLKFISFESTRYLFANEFKVPLLSPDVAAYLGTATELILPLFLLFGFGARLPTLALFIFNIIMVVSYPFLLSPEGACALKDHVLWGVLIGIPLFFGTGKISVDYLLKKKVCPNYLY